MISRGWVLKSGFGRKGEQQGVSKANPRFKGTGRSEEEGVQGREIEAQRTSSNYDFPTPPFLLGIPKLSRFPQENADLPCPLVRMSRVPKQVRRRDYNSLRSSAHRWFTLERHDQSDVSRRAGEADRFPPFARDSFVLELVLPLLGEDDIVPDG